MKWGSWELRFQLRRHRNGLVNEKDMLWNVWQWKRYALERLARRENGVLRAAHTYTVIIRECPPPPPGLSSAQTWTRLYTPGGNGFLLCKTKVGIGSPHEINPSQLRLAQMPCLNVTLNESIKIINLQLSFNALLHHHYSVTSMRIIEIYHFHNVFKFMDVSSAEAQWSAILFTCFSQYDFYCWYPLCIH